jgi:hypothetical protein
MPGRAYEKCHQPHVKRAQDAIEERLGREMMNNEAVQEMIAIVEDFLRRKKLICYGGTAINNVLPKSLQFYNTDVELPDYDFFSPDPVGDAKELADIYAKKGFPDVVASSGVHGGTFKVHVNYVPVADLTYLDPRLYGAMAPHTVVVDGIHYTPPMYLRMLMHLELSRPDGDISRWDKVAQRLALLNEAYPMRQAGCTSRVRSRIERDADKLNERHPKLLSKLRDFMAERGVVFCGSFAVNELNHELRKKRIPGITGPAELIVLSKEPKEVAMDVKRRLTADRIKADVEHFEEIGEIVPEHYVVRADGDVVAIVFKAIECHAMNLVEINKNIYRIASIDTLMTLFMPFLFISSPVIDYDMVVCYCNDLGRIADECNPAMRGVLARFDTPCYGNQTTLADIRKAKNQRFKKLRNKHDMQSRAEREYYFMRYEPKVKGKVTKDLERDTTTPQAGGVRKTKRASHKSKGKGKSHTRRARK